MRHAHWLALSTAALSISCHALGATRSAGILLALAAGALAWIGHRGHARAGGGTSGGDPSTTGASSGGTGTGSSTAADDTGTGSGTAANDTGTGSGTAANDTDTETETSACLSAPYPEETDTASCLSVDVCLCACETGRDAPSDWAPALLLPLMVRRRNRKQSLERLAGEGRLPADVVARLRQRLEDEQRDPPSAGSSPGP